MLIGVDVGTTGIKAVLVEHDGAFASELASVVVATPWRTTADGVEMDGGDLVAAVERAIAELVAGPAADGPIAAVGVTGMGEAGVLVDGYGAPTTPIIAWYDERGDVDRLIAELPDLSARTGMAATPVATIFKLPGLLATGAGRRWLNVPEYVVAALGGEQFAELSLAGRTGLFDLHRNEWWDDGLAALGVDRSLFAGDPQLGTVGAGRATFGPISGARLAVGGHDHQVAAFASGALATGCRFESLGTADALTQVVAPPLAEAIVAELTAANVTVGRTVVADRLIVMTGLNTGLVLGHIASLLGLEGDGRLAVAATAATRRPDDELRVTFERGRVNITGVGATTDPADLWRAAVDGADRATAATLERFDRLLGPADEVVVGGGWLHDPAVAAALTRRFGPLRRTGFGEPGAVGAASIAALAAGEIDQPLSEHGGSDDRR